MKKFVSFLTLLFCVSVLQANDVEPTWKQHLPEQWAKQVEKLGVKAQQGLLKLALGTALLLQEKKLVVLGHGGYFNYNNQQCGFFPTSTKKSRLGTTLAGWAACISSEGLNYNEATAKCGFKSIQPGSTGSYKFTTKKGETKSCKVYLTQ